MSETLLIKIVCTIHLASIWEAEHWTELLADNQSAIRTHLLSTRERAVAKTIKNIQVTRLQMLQVAVSWMPLPFAARTSYFKISEEAETSAGNLAEKDGNDVLHRRVSIYLSIYQSIYLSIYQSIYPSIHPSIHLYISLSLCLYICLSICLSAYLPACFSLSLSLSLSCSNISKILNISQQYCKHCWKSIEMCHSYGLIDMVLLEIGVPQFSPQKMRSLETVSAGVGS